MYIQAVFVCRKTFYAGFYQIPVAQFFSTTGMCVVSLTNVATCLESSYFKISAVQFSKQNMTSLMSAWEVLKLHPYCDSCVSIQGVVYVMHIGNSSLLIRFILLLNRARLN